MVVENMDVKKKVLSELEGYVRKDAILTSNEEMSKALVDSSRFAGDRTFKALAFIKFLH